MAAAVGTDESQNPLYRSSLSPYVSMVRAMRREARLGQALPWVVTFGGEFAGQLTVGSIVWGSARSGQVGYWIDEKFASRGIIPTALAMAADHSFRVVGLHRLEASIRPENQASRRVVEKLGFRDEGLRRRQLASTAPGGTTCATRSPWRKCRIA